MEQTIKTWTYQKGEVKISFSLDANRPSHKKELEYLLNLLDTATREIAVYYKKMKTE